MSDPIVATKAPESDVVEELRQDATANIAQAAHNSASMEHCTSDRPITSDQRSSGELSKFDDVDVYISKPADYPNTPGKLLLLLTGGTGVRSVNNQLQADMFAKEGFLVVMPDQFAGDAAPNAKTEDEIDSSWLSTIKLRVAETAKSFLLDMWLARHTPEKVMPVLGKVLETVKDEYADAIANGGGIYAAGYCFGAKYVIMLAGQQPEALSQTEPADEERTAGVKIPAIKAGAIAHATLVERKDLLAIQAPLSMVCVEDDPLFPEEILDVGRKSMAASSLQHEIKMYSGVPHGFAVVGEYDSPSIKEAQGSAFEQMLNWLQTH